MLEAVEALCSVRGRLNLISLEFKYVNQSGENRLIVLDYKYDAFTGASPLLPIGALRLGP